MSRGATQPKPTERFVAGPSAVVFNQTSALRLRSRRWCDTVAHNHPQLGSIPGTAVAYPGLSLALGVAYLGVPLVLVLGGGL